MLDQMMGIVGIVDHGWDIVGIRFRTILSLIYIDFIPLLSFRSQQGVKKKERFSESVFGPFLMIQSS